MPKYIFENGVMKLDPQYKVSQSSKNPSLEITSDAQSLTIVSSLQDIQEASQAQQNVTGKPMQVSESMIASIDIMQDSEYLNKFGTKESLDGGGLLDGLTKIFERHEVPIGLINKLLILSEYSLNFIIDDSGSMNTESDALISQASPQLKEARDPTGIRAANNKKLTRWEEAEDRIHIIFDMLAYIPTHKISISFLNRTEQLILSHHGKTPEQFSQHAHLEINKLFKKTPSGGTPLYQILSQAFKATNNTMHYVFTDGEPGDASIEQMKQLVLQRNYKMHPLTFLSCTSDDASAEWMKRIENEAPFTAELDDFVSERSEVQKAQGAAFPFTRGFWLICQLVAAINPDDLDALDEAIPFSKKTLDDLMGRKTTLTEYQRYFQMNPNAVKYGYLQQQFEREDVVAQHILMPPTTLYSAQNSNAFFHAQQTQPSAPPYYGYTP